MNGDKRTDDQSRAVSRRQFLGVTAAVGAGLTARFSTPSFAAKQDTGPNILLIISDQLHAEAMSNAGCRHIHTPALDELAASGVRFALSHSVNPLCSPARSGIFTGRTSSETGVYHNDLPIRTRIPNIGQWLSDHTNYETVYFGKWHLPRSYTNFIPGFNCLTTGVGGHGYLAGAGIARACEAYLHNRSSHNPFMMVASFLQPHDICEWLCLNARKMQQLPYPEIEHQLPPLPANFHYDPTEPEAVTGRRGNTAPQINNWDERQWRYYLWSYYRHAETLDAEVGRLLQALHDTRYADNTLVIFTADHGEGTAHHQMVRKNFIYNEALKVPLIISWPDHVAKDHVDDRHLVTGMDIMPTICDYARIDPPQDMRGASLKPLLEQRRWIDRSFVVSEVFHNEGRMLRTPQYKYIAYTDDPVEQLFDMADDPGETVNLANDSAHADVVAEHRKLLDDWHSRLTPSPDVPFGDKWQPA